MKTMIQNKTLSLCSVLLFGFFAGFATAADAPQSIEPERMAVLFYADWCGSCKVLDPKIKEARSELSDETKTLFVTFDLTDDASKMQTAMLAESLGLGEVYAEHGNKTGFMLVLDAEGKTVERKLTKTDDAATIRQALAGS